MYPKIKLHNSMQKYSFQIKIKATKIFKVVSIRIKILAWAFFLRRWTQLGIHRWGDTSSISSSPFWWLSKPQDRAFEFRLNPWGKEVPQNGLLPSRTWTAAGAVLPYRVSISTIRKWWQRAMALYNDEDYKSYWCNSWFTSLCFKVFSGTPTKNNCSLTHRWLSKLKINLDFFIFWSVCTANGHWDRSSFSGLSLPLRTSSASGKRYSGTWYYRFLKSNAKSYHVTLALQNFNDSLNIGSN